MEPSEVLRGLPVSTLGFKETVAKVAGWAASGEGMRYFACVNAHSAELAHRDERFMEALQQANLLVADGAGIVLASSITGGRIKERVTGPDLFLAVSTELNALGGKSVFYLGGNESTLAKLVVTHRQRFPRLKIAGVHAPPYRAEFSDDELAVMAAVVNAAHPDVLWLGLGAPKQEKWLHANRFRLQVPLCGPIGAMFDYFSGNVSMPPSWVQRWGLHWAHRLIREPRRLWRRNLDSPRFLYAVIKERLLNGPTVSLRSTRTPSAGNATHSTPDLASQKCRSSWSCDGQQLSTSGHDAPQSADGVEGERG